MDKDGWLPDEDEDQCAILMREELKPNWQCPGYPREGWPAGFVQWHGLWLHLQSCGVPG